MFSLEIYVMEHRKYVEKVALFLKATHTREADRVGHHWNIIVQYHSKAY